MLTHLLKKEIKEFLMERSILIGAIIIPLKSSRSWAL